MSSTSLQFRPARASDAETVADLVAPYAEEGILLPCSASEIRTRFESFTVAELRNRVVGAVALREFGAGLVEIRSLVVQNDCKGQGIGTKLILRAVESAQENDALKIFALTLRPTMFEKLGFELVEKTEFPQKVWADCANCPKEHHCDEVAVLKLL